MAYNSGVFPWLGPGSATSTFLQTSRLPRTYKIVSIDKDGKVSTVKNREVADAG